MKNVLMTFTCILALVLAAGTTLAAGTLDAPAAPTAPGSAMYTGQDLYIRLTTGAAGALRSGAFVEPLSGPAPSGPTLNDIMAAMPAADNANGATVSNVLGGKTFWGLRTDGTWGLNTGSVPVGATNVPGNNGALAITIPNGLYSGSTTATASDTNLVSGNIRAGVPIFGVTGATAVVDTSSGTAVAGNILSGKTAYVNGSLVTGSVPVGATNVPGNNGALAITIPNGLYSGSTTATASDTNLVSGNIRAGVLIFGVTGATAVVNTSSGTAVAGNILSGKTAYVNGSLVTGSVPVGATNVPGNNGALAITIPNGLYSGSTTATASDTNLVSGNIRAGVPIFGVTGATAVVDTSSGTAAASDLVSGKIAYVAGATITGTRPTIPVPKSGQTTFYATGDDGNLQKGYAFPTPRFTDNGNGTVTDNATGLIWLKNANCPGEITWTTALNWSNTLANGSCGLSDGSTAGQWRLPNLRELQSLVVYNGNSPAVPSGNPFANVLANDYWVSTTYAYSTSNAWVVELYDGSQHEDVKTDTNNVWPVRGGQ